MSRRITAADLKAEHACADQVVAFRRMFPRGSTVSRADCRRATKAGLSIDWFAERFLTAAARAELDRAMAAAWAELDRAMAAASAKYNRAMAAAWAEYDRATAAAWAEYKRARADAWAEYKRARADAWAEFDRARADALARAWKKGGAR